MRKFIHKHSRKIFTASILVKAGIGILEIIIGVFFYFTSYEALNKLGDVFLYQEIVENPDSIFLNFLNTSFHSIFIYSKSFWAFLLLTHGITKIFLIHGLLRDRGWSYIISAVIFTYFIFDQTCRLFLHPSFVLGVITLFDIFVVGMILYEYRLKNKRNIGRK